MAILLALASPEFELLAVTTVAGNLPLETTTRNALRVLALAGREDIPVAAGAARPLVVRRDRNAAVHGADGRGGPPGAGGCDGPATRSCTGRTGSAVPRHRNRARPSCPCTRSTCWPRSSSAA